MSTLVVYKTKYGSTKQYAEWIAEELGAEIIAMEKVTPATLSTHDAVVLGGYLHIGKIMGAEFLQNNWNILKDKKVALFTVAGAPATSPDREKWFAECVPANIRERVRHFPFQGRAMNLDWKDNFLMLFPKFAEKFAYWQNPTPQNQRAKEGFKSFDGVKREYIAPLVAYMRSQ